MISPHNQYYNRRNTALNKYNNEKCKRETKKVALCFLNTGAVVMMMAVCIPIICSLGCIMCDKIKNNSVYQIPSLVTSQCVKLPQAQADWLTMLLSGGRNGDVKIEGIMDFNGWHKSMKAIMTQLEAATVGPELRWLGCKITYVNTSAYWSCN